MRTQHFESVEALERALAADAKITSRWPARFILVEGLDAWKQVVQLLRARCVVIELSSFCDKDTLPYFGKVFADLEKYRDRNIVILPIGEVLRFAPNIVPVERLATLERVGKERIYIPILSASTLLAPKLKAVSRYEAGEAPETWSITGDGEISIIVAPFPTKSDCITIGGIKAYLHLWETSGAAQVLVVTQWVSSVNESWGSVQVRAYKTGYEIIASHTGNAGVLCREWGTNEQWAWLARDMGQHESFDECASRLLKVGVYDASRVYPHWEDSDKNLRWLIWLWTKLREPSNSVLGKAIGDTETVESLTESVCNIVFYTTLSLEDCRQRTWLLKALKVRAMPPSFWPLYEKTDNLDMRLSALTGISPRERKEIVITVCKLLKDNVPPDRWLPHLEANYPILAYYLSEFPLKEAELTSYMRLYARSKVCNEPLDGLFAMCEDWAREKELFKYPSRRNILEGASGTFVWEDGMGIEWAGPLYRLLTHPDSNLEVSLTVARANMPTTTRFNQGWASEDVPEREIDRIGHHYDYSYPDSLVRQLDFVQELAQRVHTMCQNHSQVIITADHGLTRFAAHGPSIPIPEGYSGDRLGRFVKPNTGFTQEVEDDKWLIEDRRLVLAVHGLFQGGAHVDREVHGGATPEEILVPVLIVRTRRADSPELKGHTAVVNLDPEGRGVLIVETSRPVAAARLVLHGLSIAGEAIGGNRWSFALEDIAPGICNGRLEYERGLLDKISFTAKQGLEKDDMGL